MRRLTILFLISMLISFAGWVPECLAGNQQLDMARGQHNFLKVTSFVTDRFEKEVDLADLYESAWLNLERGLPDPALISTATYSIYATSREILSLYAAKIEDVLKETAKRRTDDATPSIQNLWNRATNGLVAALNDPYSQYLPVEEHEELQRVLSGKPDEAKQFYGVGISIDWDTESDEGLLVISPLPGTPAERNGIHAGDIILAVDGDWLKDWEGTVADKRDKAVEKIRGEQGSSVILMIRKPDLPEPVPVTLTREPINPDQHIMKEMLDNDIGYLRLTNFYADSVNDILEAVRYLKMEGMKQLIFDLRYNPGGYLDQAVYIADLFMKKGDLITFTFGRKSPERHFIDQRTSDDGFSSIPMVVLVNQWSASASEVVTGALKDNKRATVIGEKTFGKGSVQEVFPLEGGAGLRLTVAHYYTPSGVCIHEEGIMPDIEVTGLTYDALETIQKKSYHNVSRIERLFDSDPQMKVAWEFLNGEISLANQKTDDSSDEG